MEKARLMAEIVGLLERADLKTLKKIYAFIRSIL